MASFGHQSNYSSFPGAVTDNIGFHAIYREAVDVSSVTIDDWKQRIASIIDGYKLNDIYNCDETGLFYRALPDKTLAIKGQEGLHSMSTKGVRNKLQHASAPWLSHVTAILLTHLTCMVIATIKGSQ